MYEKQALPAIALVIITLSSAGGGAEAPSPFGSINTFVGDGNGYGEFLLPGDDTLVLVDFATPAPAAALVLSGSSVKNWFRVGDGWLGASLGSVAYPFAEGNYFVYVVTSPPSPFTVTLRFANVTGEVFSNTFAPISGAFEPLAPQFPSPFVNGVGALKLQLSLPTDEALYTGFTIRESYSTAEVVYRQERWSTPKGIAECFGAVSTAAGGLATYGASLFSPNLHDGPVTLTYLRDSGSPATGIEANGFWLQRAVGDIPRASWASVAPPGWDAFQAHPAVDQIPTCVIATTAGILP
jgi:hypothetical protein